MRTTKMHEKAIMILCQLLTEPFIHFTVLCSSCIAMDDWCIDTTNKCSRLLWERWENVSWSRRRWYQISSMTEIFFWSVPCHGISVIRKLGGDTGSRVMRTRATWNWSQLSISPTSIVECQYWLKSRKMKWREVWSQCSNINWKLKRKKTLRRWVK